MALDWIKYMESLASKPGLYKRLFLFHRKSCESFSDFVRNFSRWTWWKGNGKKRGLTLLSVQKLQWHHQACALTSKLSLSAKRRKRGRTRAGETKSHFTLALLFSFRDRALPLTEPTFSGLIRAKNIKVFSRCAVNQQGLFERMITP